jgi:hypothetical protein
MPMLQFVCDCGNEFEKIVPAKKELYKWCNHCNELTVWKVIIEPTLENHKEQVCSSCLGNKHVPPVLSNEVHGVEEIVEPCPVCGKAAHHVIRVETRGSRSGGPGVSDSSVRFHFNYLSSDV